MVNRKIFSKAEPADIENVLPAKNTDSVDNLLKSKRNFISHREIYDQSFGSENALQVNRLIDSNRFNALNATQMSPKKVESNDESSRSVCSEDQAKLQIEEHAKLSNTPRNIGIAKSE
jgi:hypothetical protein